MRRLEACLEKDHDYREHHAPISRPRSPAPRPRSVRGCHCRYYAGCRGETATRSLQDGERLSGHVPSDQDDRRDQHLLPRSRAEGCARGIAAARLSDLLPHVSQPDPGPGGPVPRDRSRLPRLWPERHASPRVIQVHVRSLRRARRRPAGPARRQALRDVRHGLRRAGRLAAGGWRSNIPSASAASSFRTATPTTKD